MAITVHCGVDGRVFMEVEEKATVQNVLDVVNREVTCNSFFKEVEADARPVFKELNSQWRIVHRETDNGDGTTSISESDPEYSPETVMGILDFADVKGQDSVRLRDGQLHFIACVWEPDDSLVVG